ncbi:putative tRNA threonylcarbamoyladenosine biosynthesis protein YwlC [Sterolibacterium denitrificans]|uniref:Threonylcarbamoyl-AMP synthase n=1 Tax=Sterolibacterium denitrificans TaxID=157592 RepID=A0A7Z7HT84_9PROT|nr:L-threonylcarbamoyladenylate synthase [Sterolibacterium denitrificans]SMB32288.1 putative tRNA threonylcarbamoyladenosine biosynthesis protein YwlC [Sterolibacterium denitrificans]
MNSLGRNLEAAVAALQAGELVAFPTETVYGLGADASNPAAVAKIFAAKGRPADHPLIVHLPGADALDRWAREIPEAARRLAAAFWPGPLTLILKRQPQVLDAVTGGQDTVGLRVPDHRLALALLRSFDEASGGLGAGLAAPSANRFGRISPTTAAHVREELGEQVKVILDGGPCMVGIESTIVDLSNEVPRILRPGAITHQALEQVLGQRLTRDAVTAATPRVSGSLAAHYAPRTPLRLVGAADLPAVLAAELQAGRRCAVLAQHAPQPATLPANCHWVRTASRAADYAQALYATLRRCDDGQHDLILVETPPDAEVWRAVTDRLQRAAHGSGAENEGIEGLVEVPAPAGREG